jgi:hypothetical protein
MNNDSNSATRSTIPVIAGTIGKFQCAPAQGLALVQVEYPPHLKYSHVQHTGQSG